MQGKMNISELLPELVTMNIWSNATIYPAFYQWLQLCADADGWVETTEVEAGLDPMDFRQLQCKVSTWIEYGVPLN